MNLLKRSLQCACHAAVGIALIHLLCTTAAAAEGGEGWRQTYDLVMKWLNFGILVFLFLKFARKPLVDFLTIRGEELARDVKRLEDDKKASVAKSKETLETIQKGEAHIATIKERIVLQGEREKEKIIVEAREQGNFMLDEARKRIGNQIEQAKRTFQMELIDTAVELATERLPQEITDADHAKLLERYLASAG